MRLSVKACLRLLCGISVLFSVHGEITSTADTSSQAATAAPNTANRLLTSAHREAETQAATWGRSATRNPAEVTATTAHTAVSHATDTEASRTNGSTARSVVVTTAAAATSSGPPVLHTPTVVTAARPTGDAQPPPNATISEPVQPTEGKTQRSSSSPPSTDVTSPDTASAKSLRLTSTKTPEVMSSSSPGTSSQTSHAVSSSSSSTATVTSPASEVPDPTSSPVTTTKTLATSSSASSHSPTESPTDGSSISTSSISTSAVSTSAVSSTSPAGIFPRRLTIPSTTPTPAITAAPCKVSKVPPGPSEVQPCSTRGAVSHCLIAIASLAVLACIFMVSTVILCTKLSSRRYKVRNPKQSTEMMCISALLPEEEEFTYTRRRSPIANGVLVFPSGRDSDEEGGDNVTLSSFLPDNDRYV